MTTVAVSGAAGGVGRRLAARLREEHGVERVAGIDVRPPPDGTPFDTFTEADLATGDPGPALAGAEVLVHLAFRPGGEVAEAAAVNSAGTRRLLEAADAAGVRRVVAVSSATVYGAWPSNPVPLTEDAVVRPNEGFAYATHKAEVERLVADWGQSRPGRSACVLRPAPAVAEDELSWLARALQAALRFRAGHTEAPMQYLHLDDFAAAVGVVARCDVTGPVNVAPDGWLDADQVRVIVGAPPKVRLSERVADRLVTWGWRRRLSEVPPGVVPYLVHPWVVANDRLRALGWRPTHSNEEALVAGVEAPPWTDLSPKRRQELALAGAGGLLLAGGGTTAAVVWRHLRRR